MRKNYFEKIVKYMKKVYNIENELKRITDARVKNNNILSIKEVKRLVNKSEPVESWTDQTMYERVNVYERTSLFKIIRARQDIENSIFHILVNSPM